MWRPETAGLGASDAGGSRPVTGPAAGYAAGDAALLEDWRRLSTSDHFYYMCTKWFQDGDVHRYFSPWESPYEAHIAFMNVLADLALRVGRPARRER